MPIKFNRSLAPTLGVEWEVALIDPVTRDLVPKAEQLISIVRSKHPEYHLEAEFLQNTIELVTGICSTVPQAVNELSQSLNALKAGAAELGLKLWASGSHPFSDFRKNPVSDKKAYKEIIDRTQYWGNQMLIWGLHVHVGIKHEDRVWPIINALLTKYPHILALSASSPAWEGVDTGYASNRTMLYQQLPTAGLPYQFSSWSAWESFMEEQSKSGVINHTNSMHFDIRPAPNWGTIEVRIADVPTNLRELSTVVALIHCLVVHYDRMIDRGEQLPTLQQWHVAENKWRAARYGLEAEIITSRQTDERLVTDDLRDLIQQLLPLAEELGCDQELQLLDETIDRGGSYQRQRRAFEQTGSWIAAIDLSCREMEELTPLEGRF